MKTLKIALLAAATTLVMGGSALAQDVDVSFNVGINSDYAFRGVSQTDESAQIYGGADLTSGIFYTGVWASNVDFLDSTDAEIDVYAGFKPVAGPVNLDLGVVYYGYVNAPGGSDYGYWEGKAAASVAAGSGTIGAALYYSPDFFGSVDGATYYEVNGSFPVAEKISVSGAIGHQAVDGAGDYNTWNLGVGVALTDKLGVDLRYHDTDEHGFGSIYDKRVVVGLKAAF